MFLQRKLWFPVIIGFIGVITFFWYPNLTHRCSNLSYLTAFLKDWCKEAFDFLKSDKEIKEEQENNVNEEFKKNIKYEKSDGPEMPLFLPEELKKFDGSGDSKGIFLAVLGEVFDVEKGAHHYKPGGAYSFFAGIDASKAYVTGAFNKMDLVDDLSELDDTSLLSIEDWLNFYRNEYPLVGKVVGRYYDVYGNPTSALEEVWKRIKQGHKNKWLENREKEIFPSCNSEWSREKGGRVWCTNKSGGVDRQWAGVPRKFFKIGRDSRCVCVRDFGPPSGSESTMDDSNGDLEHPQLNEYPNCPTHSSSCTVDYSDM